METEIQSTEISDFLKQMQYRCPDFKASANPTSSRDPYKHDLGRIIHSASFRRLQAKTQVMGTGEGDFHRTRLTHTMEVGQIARGILWHLDDQNIEYKTFLPSSELIEAISYAHDLGHPPYGHSGERALHAKMYNYGGFEGNAQTIRIVTRLEKYFPNKGICPTRRLLLGILKYPAVLGSFEKNLNKPPKCYYDTDFGLVSDALSIFSEADINLFTSKNEKGKTVHKTLDCSIMEIADDIAYGIHDMEDGIARGIIREKDVKEGFILAFETANVLEIGRFVILEIFDMLFSDDSCDRKHAISVLVNYFVTNVEICENHNFEHLFLKLNARLPANVQGILEYLKVQVTFNHIVKRREVQMLEYKGEKIIKDLFDILSERPVQLIGEKNLFAYDERIRPIFETNNQIEDIAISKITLAEDRQIVARAVCDYIAGMTNPYAEKIHRRLNEPGFGTSTDEL